MSNRFNKICTPTRGRQTDKLTEWSVLIYLFSCWLTKLNQSTHVLNQFIYIVWIFMQRVIVNLQNYGWYKRKERRSIDKVTDTEFSENCIIQLAYLPLNSDVKSLTNCEFNLNCTLWSFINEKIFGTQYKVILYTIIDF